MIKLTVKHVTENKCYMPDQTYQAYFLQNAIVYEPRKTGDRQYLQKRHSKMFITAFRLSIDFSHYDNKQSMSAGLGW